MSRYVIGRIGQAALVLWAAFTVSFVLLQALPGDAILIKFLNPELGLGPEQIAEIRASYAADSPLWMQYAHTVANFLTGHFGYSIHAGDRTAPRLRTRDSLREAARHTPGATRRMAATPCSPRPTSRSTSRRASIRA